jgi:hypothetical protein
MLQWGNPEDAARTPSTSGLFIGACGGSVAAAGPEMRLQRISETSAERTGHWPLTLMNPGSGARAREARDATRWAGAHCASARDWDGMDGTTQALPAPER